MYKPVEAKQGLMGRKARLARPVSPAARILSASDPLPVKLENSVR